MTDFLDEFFSADGPLRKAMRGFEERGGQQDMARQIYLAYENDEIALIEAGTGIGKSLAYLIPAILWAVRKKEKTVISTYTIALQEQLIQKDIPLALKSMDVDLKAVMVKGMSNYLCVRKLEEIEEYDRDIEGIRAWAERTKDGSYSDLPFSIAGPTWDRVNADVHSCNHVHCPYYKSCHFFKARRQADDAQLVVVNHHILFADLATKKSKGEEKAILPAFQRVVIDEAHHLEEVALDSLSKRFDRLNLVRLLGRLYSDLHPERSRLLMVRKSIKDAQSSLIARLEIDLPAEKRDLVEKIERAFSSLEAFCRVTVETREQRWRLRDEHFGHPLFKNEVVPLFEEVITSLKRFASSLSALKDEIEEQHVVEIGGIAKRLEEEGLGLEAFFETDTEVKRVRWVEANGVNLTLVNAELNVSSYLNDELFEKLSTLTLCSATLSCAGDFKHLRDRLGITGEKTITEKIYPSPFDYPNKALLAITTDLPDPSDPGFTKEASKAIFRALEESDGGAFVLFTSYEMLRSSYHELVPLAEKAGFSFLKQGDGPRNLLIDKFKKHPRSVLFGTDSFWEGVDIAGDALRLVIIVKLPFRVPTDPLMQAMTEALEKEGKNSFMEYQVPQAVMKFKQGFGRLIRTKEDRGAILCLDKRLITKSYGKLFLQSLPDCKTLFAPSEEVFEEMKRFWSVADSNR